MLAFLAALAAALVGVQAGTWPQLCLRASSSLHDSALAAVLRARLDFYFRTPLGHMLARLSRDVDACDAALPSMLAQTFSCIAALIAALLAIVATSPLVLPPVLLVGLAFGRIVCDYQAHSTCPVHMPCTHHKYTPHIHTTHTHHTYTYTYTCTCHARIMHAPCMNYLSRPRRRRSGSSPCCTGQ